MHSLERTGTVDAGGSDLRVHNLVVAQLVSTTPTPIHRPRRPGHLHLTLTTVGAVVLAAIIIALLVDRIFPSSSSLPGTGSSVAATQVRSLPPFTRLDLTGDNNIIVHVGARQAVIVHADNNLLSRVTTQVRSGSLVIGATTGALKTKSQMFVEVNVPSLRAVTLEGDGNITVTGINSPSVSAGIPGSGTITASGTTTRLDLTIGGSGTASLGQLITRDATASIPGSGSIMLTPTRSFNASIPGSGRILSAATPSTSAQESPAAARSALDNRARS